METLSTEFADWIFEDHFPRLERNIEEVGLSISNCIPSTFEAYCKVFHPFEETTDEPDTLAPLERPKNLRLVINSGEPDKQIEEPKKQDGTVDIFEDFWARREKYESKHWEFKSWKYVFEKYGLVFHNEASAYTLDRKFTQIGYPRNLMFPQEGYLCREKFIQLLDILEKQSAEVEVYIYQMVPNTIWKDDKAEDLVKCTFAETLEYFNFDFKGYLFAIDRTWVVFTDTDLDFTLVGGNKQLIQAILDSELEALLCQNSTRIDAYSDKINESRILAKTSPAKKKLNWWQKWFNS